MDKNMIHVYIQISLIITNAVLSAS